MRIDIEVKVSIIVPVYNVEKFIGRCLESLINQTERSAEIIVVDDGSPDQSGYIADQYSKIDNRIQVIHKINGGLSSARNAGMEKAIGEYVMFVDSDDWLEPNAVEILFYTAKWYNADLVRFMWIRENTQDNIKTYEKPLFKNNIKLTRDEIKEKILPIVMTGSKLNSCCKNFILNKIIKENNLKFDEKQLFMEDLIFTLDLLTYSNSYVYIPKILYHYFINDAGLTATITEEKVKYIIRGNLMFFDYLEKWGMDNAENNKILTKRVANSLATSIVSLITVNGLKIKRTYYSIKNILDNNEIQKILSNFDNSDMKIRNKITLFLIRNNKILFFIYYSLGLNVIKKIYNKFKKSINIINLKLINVKK